MYKSSDVVIWWTALLVMVYIRGDVAQSFIKTIWNTSTQKPTGQLFNRY